MDTKSTKPKPPTKPSTAFFLYKQDIHEQLKKEHPHKNMIELTKVASEKWSHVDAETKAKYQKKNKEAKAKYEKEIKEYIEKHGEPESHSEEEKEDSGKPEPPTKPSTAFFLFKREMNEQVKKEHPHKNMVEITKIMSEKWNNADAKTKAEYQKKNKEAKEKYEKELEEYVEKYGEVEKKKRGRLNIKPHSDEEEDGDEESEEEEKKPAKKKAK
mmetsp:Transcript_18628/g.21432  ORF Transcript_18628/g.21432 Transcript_18628/m.21432 type:complete len:214 (+) Transcript_18628:34-675(+)